MFRGAWDHDLSLMISMLGMMDMTHYGNVIIICQEEARNPLCEFMSGGGDCAQNSLMEEPDVSSGADIQKIRSRLIASSPDYDPVQIECGPSRFRVEDDELLDSMEEISEDSLREEDLSSLPSHIMISPDSDFLNVGIFREDFYDPMHDRIESIAGCVDNIPGEDPGASQSVSSHQRSIENLKGSDEPRIILSISGGEGAPCVGMEIGEND